MRDIGIRERIHHDALYLQVPWPILSIGYTGRLLWYLSRRVHAVLHPL
jgi:hypothetical protein